MQPIVVVEGVREGETRRVVADRKLYRALHPGFDHVTVIPGGGKAECRALLRGLREAIAVFSNHLNAVALIDRDYALNSSQGEGVFQLPVAMVENFLLDPEVVWEAIQSVAETSGLHSVSDVTNALTDILTASESEEAERRALSLLGTSFFRPARPIGEVSSMAEAFSREVVLKYSGEAIATAAKTARAEVEKARENDRRREDFHGKEMLGKFYSAHLARTPLSRVVFTFEAARHARRRKAITKFFDGFFATVIPFWAAQQAVAADGAAPRS